MSGAVEREDRGVRGLVFSIERGSYHDGPGLRTTVFLKGCPLCCLWCHNPESQLGRPELYYLEEKCTLCGACAQLCPTGCHSVEAGGHSIDRSACVTCGRCVQGCPVAALEIKGRCMDVEEVMAVVRRDMAFYRKSGGGLTLSGGEPMQQFAFALELLRAAHAEGIHTCLETSGFSSAERMSEIAPYVDLFLYDYKESDPGRHQEYTGVPQDAILRNLFLLDERGARIVLRCPMIPGCNDRPEHLQAIAALSRKLTNLVEINLMPYHPMGMSKSRHIGREYPLSDQFAEKEQVEQWLSTLRALTDIRVVKG